MSTIENPSPNLSSAVATTERQLLMGGTPKTALAREPPQRAALLLRGEALKCFVFHSNEIRYKLT